MVRSAGATNFYFRALPGHFDGAGSAISFTFYKPAGWPVRIAIAATIIKDNGTIRNNANAYVAKTQWTRFATNLVLNTRRYR